MRAVFTYHSIDDSGSPISVHPEAFGRHIKWMVSSGVDVVSLREIANLPDEANAVALTFDDGVANFVTHAAPFLRDHGLPATLFVVTDRVGRTNQWDGRPSPGIPAVPLLDWPELERLSSQGIALGAHTRTHPDVTQLDAAALEDEIAGSAACLKSRTGVMPDAFAYPYGAVNEASAGRVAAIFSCGCTTDHRPVARDEPRALLPRLDMYYYQRKGSLEAWGTSRFGHDLSMVRLRRRLRATIARATRKRWP